MKRKLFIMTIFLSVFVVDYFLFDSENSKSIMLAEIIGYYGDRPPRDDRPPKWCEILTCLVLAAWFIFMFFVFPYMIISNK